MLNSKSRSLTGCKKYDLPCTSHFTKAGNANSAITKNGKASPSFFSRPLSVRAWRKKDGKAYSLKQAWGSGRQLYPEAITSP